MLFSQYQQIKSHLEAVEAIITTSKQSADIGELLNHKHLKEKKTNRTIFYKSLKTSDFWQDKACLYEMLSMMIAILVHCSLYSQNSVLISKPGL